MRWYTGVGSRETPKEVGDVMREFAAIAERDGFGLRSGAAGGADTFFEEGVSHPSNKQVFIAWEGFSNRSSKEDGVLCITGPLIKEAEAIASQIHPAWDVLKKDGKPVMTRGAKALHTRNCFQVLGPMLLEPSKFLICWAPISKDGSPTGGTRTAWELARLKGVPCYNLAKESTMERILAYIERERDE